jgi:hypothetical protein
VTHALLAPLSRVDAWQCHVLQCPCRIVVPMRVPMLVPMRVPVVQYTFAVWFLWDGGALPAASASSPTASAVTSVGGNSFVSIVLVGGFLTIDFGASPLASTSPMVVANSGYHVAITRVRGS